MKNPILFTFLAIIVLSCTDQSTVNKSLIADQELELGVDGMVCSFGCAKYIEEEVSKLSGVSGCTVDFENGKAQIAFASEAIDKDEIVNAISNLNDGQYKVSVLNISSSKSLNKSGGAEKTNTKKDHSPEVTFHFPQLVTYFMHRLIR